MKDLFVEQNKRQLLKDDKIAIDNMLKVLDSKIIYPKDGEDNVVENKLLAIVKGREEVYNGICELMDLAGIDSSTDESYKNKIINALKTNYKEMREISVRKIGFEDSEARRSDDYLSSISASIKLSRKVCRSILDRIERLEDPDKVKQEKIKKAITGSIIERYSNG